jgi:transcriptional regulator with XRE-family HTH domain
MVETFGKWLRQRRKEKNLGLREAAVKVGVSATFLSRIENGNESAMPSEKVIRELAKVLDYDFDTIMQLAGRVPEDIAQLIKSDPGMPRFLRSAHAEKFSSNELIELLSSRIERKKEKE